jgi:hypothetical protein
MVGSIDPRCETLRGTHWPVKVAGVFGTRVAENHLGQRSATASIGRTYGCKRSDQTLKNSCGTGAVHIWVPAFAGTTIGGTFARHDKSSYPAQAGYPVRRGFSIPSLAFRNTGSSAFADDDGRGCGTRFGPRHIRASRILSSSHFKQPRDQRDTTSRSRRANPREFCPNVPPLKFRGRRECRALDAPAASHAK